MKLGILPSLIFDLTVGDVSNPTIDISASMSVRPYIDVVATYSSLGLTGVSGQPRLFLTPQAQCNAKHKLMLDYGYGVDDCFFQTSAQGNFL